MSYWLTEQFILHSQWCGSVESYPSFVGVRAKFMFHHKTPPQIHKWYLQITVTLMHLDCTCGEVTWMNGAAANFCKSMNSDTYWEVTEQFWYCHLPCSMSLIRECTICFILIYFFVDSIDINKMLGSHTWSWLECCTISVLLNNICRCSWDPFGRWTDVLPPV